MGKDNRRAIEAYRRRRIQRLRARFDDDDNAENGRNSGGNGGGGHGNTKIPFGLCQREGITIGKDWSPKDAWDALEGKGYSAKETYTELKKTGKVAPKKTKMTDVDAKKALKTVSDYKKSQKELEKANKTEKKFLKEFDKASDDQSMWERTAKVAKAEMDSLGNREDLPPHMQRYFDVHKSNYDEAVEKEQEAKQRKENASAMANEAMERRKELAEKVSSGKEEYERTVDSILQNHPYAEKIKESRKIEEETDDFRSELAEAEKDAQSVEADIEGMKMRAERMRAEGQEHLAKFCEEHGIAPKEEKLRECEAKIAELRPKAEEAERRLAELKGDAKEKDWKQIYDLSVDRDTAKDGPYPTVEKLVDWYLWKNGVEFLAPCKYASQPTEEKIIGRLAGGDKTGGSCASLAFAYIANKAGYKVLDFRGSFSRLFFGRHDSELTEKLGGMSVSSKDDMDASNQLLSKVEEGKEYWFATGRHAAVVRKRNGALEYLEMQKPKISAEDENGWKTLDNEALRMRFCAVTKRKSAVATCMIDADTLAKNQEFISLMGYINTARDKQKKGAGGYAK